MPGARYLCHVHHNFVHIIWLVDFFQPEKGGHGPYSARAQGLSERCKGSIVQSLKLQEERPEAGPSVSKLLSVPVLVVLEHHQQAMDGHLLVQEIKLLGPFSLVSLLHAWWIDELVVDIVPQIVVVFCHLY